MNENSNKIVIVTVGAQGIGSCIANDLRIAGYQIVVFDNDKEAILEKQSQNPEIQHLQVDVSSEEQIVAALKKVNTATLYTVVNSAAISANTMPIELKLEDWNRVISVNLTGPFLLAKHCAPYLRKNKGAIVNIASTRALMSEPNTEAYSASKGGLLSLTHALAMSLAPDIRVNAISPGWIEVGHLKKKSSQQKVEHSEADKMQHPAGRVGIPEDISSMVTFLISNDAGFITGQSFIVDGGITRKMIYV
jgi:NAD(P)-dependent dehydrogenase (short-subunit alcohol dehydrogenase family)